MNEYWKVQIGMDGQWLICPTKYAALRAASQKKARKKRRTLVRIVSGAGTVGFFILRSGHKRPRDDRDLFGDFRQGHLTKAAPENEEMRP